MQARSYRPDLGQFLSEDRFEAAGLDLFLQADPLTQNRYAFAGGNPVSRVEWDGHNWEQAAVYDKYGDGKAGAAASRRHARRSNLEIYRTPEGYTQSTAARTATNPRAPQHRRISATSYLASQVLEKEENRSGLNKFIDDFGAEIERRAGEAANSPWEGVSNPGAVWDAWREQQVRSALDPAGEATRQASGIVEGAAESCSSGSAGEATAGCLWTGFSLFGLRGRGGVVGAARAGHDIPRKFVTTPRGTTFDVPGGWQARTADNGRGIVYQRPGATGNADMIRIMDPTDKYPGGYFRWYNDRGQPLDVYGKPGPPSATHIPEDSIGKIPRWPTG